MDCSVQNTELVPLENWPKLVYLIPLPPATIFKGEFDLPYLSLA